MNLINLVNGLAQLDDALKRKAAGVVNTAHTLRNWLFGYYIVEYEQKGEDRAKYGDQILENISVELKDKVKGSSVTNLKLFRQFYLTYPQIGQTLSDDFIAGFVSDTVAGIGQTLSDQSGNKSLSIIAKGIHQTVSDESIKESDIKDIDITIEKHQTVSDELKADAIITPPVQLVTRLAFSHFVELIKIDDPLKRAFYEIESLHGTWSVRKLQDQIARLVYERSGLSKNKAGLVRYANKNIEPVSPEELIRDKFLFDFLGFPEKDVVKESDLEKALLDGIEDFLLELGNGFCFEARQKSILVDGEYFYVDLVFYHRILHCHVLIELKIDKFKHEYVSQLNSYVNYYNDVEKVAGDREPIGILLCTGVNKSMVKYATGGLNTKLFVREYKVNLPDEEELKAYIEKKKNELD
jgi:predicted nuclease of restriction endonuclease-like (RecB) superfamily